MAACTESEFAVLVDSAGSQPERRSELIDLLREDHPHYDQRGASTVVRMRGWVLLALGRHGPVEGARLFLLEELDTGLDPYLIAAAAVALRACVPPEAVWTPYVLRALREIRSRNESVALDHYGAYPTATSARVTTPVRELLATLVWLGPAAREGLAELKVWRAERSLGKSFHAALDETIHVLERATETKTAPRGAACCALGESLGAVLSRVFSERTSSVPVETVEFEDHLGQTLRFGEFFWGQPAILAFFYTRCDNPLKCSLTISQLGQIQRRLEQRGLSAKIRTAAVTYDPAFDTAERLRGYASNRGLQLGPDHRVLRSPEGMDVLRRHFALGVNFVASLVNRHRIELYLLDRHGRVAASFQRVRWNPDDVIARVLEVAAESEGGASSTGNARSSRGRAMSEFSGPVASLAFAFFPKCPMCWAAYLSVFGVVGLDKVLHLPWVKALLILTMLVNLGAIWHRGRLTGKWQPFALTASGSVAIFGARFFVDYPSLAFAGIALVVAGSLVSALHAIPARTAPTLARAN